MKKIKGLKDWLEYIAQNIEVSNNKLDILLEAQKEKEFSEQNIPNIKEKYLSVKEVATLIRLSERTVYRRYYEGKLKSFKLGGLRVFPLSDVKRFIREERKKKKRKV